MAEMDRMEKILVDICMCFNVWYPYYCTYLYYEFIFMCICMYRSVFSLEVTVC